MCPIAVDAKNDSGRVRETDMKITMTTFTTLDILYLKLSRRLCTVKSV